MIYGWIRTSRAAADGLAGMYPETQVLAQADAGVPTLPASDCSLTSTSLTALTPALVGCLRSDGIVSVGGSVRLGVLLSIR